MNANLLSRLQGLTAPDRGIDADIFQLLGGSEWDKAYIRAQEPCGCPHDLAVSTARERYSPAYTASIDAAVALCERVLPGWTGFVDFGGGTPSIANLVGPPKEEGEDFEGNPVEVRDDVQGEGPTPAIALLIAILTALEASNG